MYAHYDEDGFFVALLALDKPTADHLFRKNNLDGEIRRITRVQYRLICLEAEQRRNARIMNTIRSNQLVGA